MEQQTIQFAEPALRPTRSNTQSVGGVTYLRSRSKSRSKRTNSIDLTKIKTLEDAEDEDAGLRDERDYKRRQVRRSLQNCALHLQLTLNKHVGLQCWPDIHPGLPVHRCHLRRYWHLASLRFLLDLHSSA